MIKCPLMQLSNYSAYTNMFGMEEKYFLLLLLALLHEDCSKNCFYKSYLWQDMGI